MNNTPSGTEAYTTPIDTENKSIIPNNEIIEIDAHLGEAMSPHPQYSQSTLDAEDMAIIADELAELGKKKASALIEIERRHMVDNDEHVLRFNALDLTGIMMGLAIARTRCNYQGEMDVVASIAEFGQAVVEDNEALLAEEFRWKDVPHLKPTGEVDFIDPFRVVNGSQNLTFVDNKGERLSPEALREDVNIGV